MQYSTPALLALIVGGAFATPQFPAKGGKSPKGKVGKGSESPKGDGGCSPLELVIG
jgi:hypothetical protein